MGRDGPFCGYSGHSCRLCSCRCHAGAAAGAAAGAPVVPRQGAAWLLRPDNKNVREKQDSASTEIFNKMVRFILVFVYEHVKKKIYKSNKEIFLEQGTTPSHE